MTDAQAFGSIKCAQCARRQPLVNLRKAGIKPGPTLTSNDPTLVKVFRCSSTLLRFPFNSAQKVH